MKKNLLTALLVLMGAIALTACSKSDTTDTDTTAPPSVDGEITYDFTAALALTRTTLDGDTLGWNGEGDAYGVLVADAQGNVLKNVRMTVTGGDTAGTVTAPEGAVLYGYYPYDSSFGSVATLGDVKFSLPSQSAAGGEFDPSHHFLAARADISGTSAHAVLKPLVSLLEIGVFDTSGIGAGEGITGFSVAATGCSGTFTAEWGATVTPGRASGAEVYAETPAGAFKVADSASAVAGRLCIPVPKGTYGELTVTVYTDSRESGVRLAFTDTDCRGDFCALDCDLASGAKVEAKFDFAVRNIADNSFNFTVDVTPASACYMWGITSQANLDDYGFTLDEYAQALFGQCEGMSLDEALEYGMVTSGAMHDYESEAYVVDSPGRYHLFAFAVESVDDAMDIASAVNSLEFAIIDTEGIPALPEDVTVGFLPARYDSTRGDWAVSEDGGYEFAEEYAEDVYFYPTADNRHESIFLVVSTVYWRMEGYPLPDGEVIEKNADVQLVRFVTDEENQVYEMPVNGADGEMICELSLRIPKRVVTPVKWVGGTPSFGFAYDGKSDDGSGERVRQTQSVDYTVDRTWAGNMNFFALTMSGNDEASIYDFTEVANWLSIEEEAVSTDGDTATMRLNIKAKGNPNRSARYATVFVVYPEFAEIYNRASLLLHSWSTMLSANAGEIFYISQAGNTSGAELDDSDWTDVDDDEEESGNFITNITGGDVTWEVVTSGNLYTRYAGQNVPVVYQVNVNGKTDELKIEMKDVIPDYSVTPDNTSDIVLKWNNKGNVLTVTDFPTYTTAGHTAACIFYCGGWDQFTNKGLVVLNIVNWD